MGTRRDRHGTKPQCSPISLHQVGDPRPQRYTQGCFYFQTHSLRLDISQDFSRSICHQKNSIKAKPRWQQVNKAPGEETYSIIVPQNPPVTASCTAFGLSRVVLKAPWPGCSSRRDSEMLPASQSPPLWLSRHPLTYPHHQYIGEFEKSWEHDPLGDNFCFVFGMYFSLDPGQGWPLGRGEQCGLFSRKELLDVFPSWVAPPGHVHSGPTHSD